jgi:hypothetical protein
MDLDEALDRLYAVPLEEFTPMRNELAKELQDPEASKVIKGLKKPNLAAWALNQLARKHSAELDELFGATDRVRQAQRRVLSGGKASGLREASDERNKVVSKLTKLAGNLLIDSGHAAAASTLSAVSDSLVAIASDNVAAELLKRGRLSREVRSEAVVDVGGLSLVPEAAEAAEPRDDLAAEQAAREALENARKRVRDTEQSAKEAEAEAWRLERAAEDAERALKSARESAEFARRAADARRQEAEAASKELDELRK